MKKSFLVLFSLLFAFSTYAQRTEHSDRNHTLTIGSGLPIVQKSMLQFEHSLGSNWAIGENISYHYGLLGSTQIWSGPKLEFLTRYYFTDQTIKHGGNWFAQIKGGAAFLTNPLASVEGFDKDMLLADEFGTLILTNSSDPNSTIKIFENGNNWLTAGGGVAIGYKKITCKGWVWEVFMGYHYWSTPNYFTKEFEEWVSEPQNALDYDGDANIVIDNIEDGTDYLWNFTYGFPVDLQFKIGKILNW